MAWLKLHYWPVGLNEKVAGYFNTDHIYSITPNGKNSRLHFAVPDKDGHVTRTVEESLEVIASLLPDVDSDD